MRKLRAGAGVCTRALGIGALVWSVIPFGTPAHAAEATLRVDKQGWFWRHAIQVPVDPLGEYERLTQQKAPCPPPQPAPPLPCPSVPLRPSPFEDDHLMVGRLSSLPNDADRDQAVALFLFDLTWMDPGTKVSGATIQLEESDDDLTGQPGANNPTNLGVGHPNRRPSANINSAQAKIRACPVFEFWGGSQPTQPALWAEQPKVACDKAAAPGNRQVVEREGRSVPVWQFDITPIARLWGSDPFASQGLAIVPETGAGDFMVSLHGNTYVIERDLVTGQDLSTTLVQRAFGAMRFVPPPSVSEPSSDGRDAVSPAVGGPVTDVLGESLQGALDALPEVSPVNRFIGVVHGPRALPALERTAFQGQASTPGYAWLPVVGGLAGLRMFVQLFLPGLRREHRVAAASRRLREAPVAATGTVE